MTDEEIMQMWFASNRATGAIVEGIKHFARRIAEIEREECAQVCEMNAIRSMLLQSKEAHYQSAADIRARSEK